MNTLFLLMAEFGQADIPLAAVAEKYLGLSAKEAAQRASKQSLPFPVFRGGSQKSPWLVSATELAKWIDREREKAARDWKAIQSAA